MKTYEEKEIRWLDCDDYDLHKTTAFISKTIATNNNQNLCKIAVCDEKQIKEKSFIWNQITMQQKRKRIQVVDQIYLSK